MVRVVRLERTVSWSQTRRDTNFAIPGYSFFCHYTTANGKNKDSSVCGHSCGQSRFCAVFGNRRKSSKRRCYKALRRFALPCSGYRHGTPKPGAIPTSLYPDKDMPPASGRHIYYTSFFPRLQGKNLSWCLLYSGAFPPRRITAPAPHSGRPPDRSFPRPRPGPPGPYGRRPPAYDRWAFADPDRG